MKNTSSTSEGLLTADEIGLRLGVTGRTVLNWAADHTIPTALRVGRVVRFNLEDVMQSLQEKTERNLAAVFAAMHEETACNLKAAVTSPSLP
jgi:excisionase family DNA binding protein